MGSTETELKRILSDLNVTPLLLGTYDKRFPGFVSKAKPACAIVNTAFRETGGEHWIAMAWYPPNNSFYMFDPFGFSDQKLKQIYDFEYQGLLRRSALTSSKDRCVQLIRSTDTVQGPNSAACGLFCCLFLKSFACYPARPMNGNPIIDIVRGVPNERLTDPSSLPILYRNQENMYAFLENHSPYFVSHEREIKRKTAFDYIQ
ncbi:protease [Equine adenovirus 2]|uniref:Protease n=1 Tax=Equine adenovirus B serotype 2 TaxID=67603 RepID=A0A0K1DCS1_ADEE2|nr:protease [Equine adenovirus 2]AKT26034.1 protease [Equine adenovirus 2]